MWDHHQHHKGSVWAKILTGEYQSLLGDNSFLDQDLLFTSPSNLVLDLVKPGPCISSKIDKVEIPHFPLFWM